LRRTETTSHECRDARSAQLIQLGAASAVIAVPSGFGLALAGLCISQLILIFRRPARFVLNLIGHNGYWSSRPHLRCKSRCFSTGYWKELGTEVSKFLPSTLAEGGLRFIFQIPFQVTPSRPAWEDAGLRR
jgi:hypothetical protein